MLQAEPTRERCEARDQAEANRILATRFPKARIVTVRLIEEVPEGSVFRAVLNTPDHRTITDTVEAGGASEARELLLSRHPGSRFTSFYRHGGSSTRRSGPHPASRQGHVPGLLRKPA